MYGRSFEDPDGHHWEVMWMDVAAATAHSPPRPTPDAVFRRVGKAKRAHHSR